MLQRCLLLTGGVSMISGPLSPCTRSLDPRHDGPVRPLVFPFFGLTEVPGLLLLFEDLPRGNLLVTWPWVPSLRDPNFQLYVLLLGAC